MSIFYYSFVLLTWLVVWIKHRNLLHPFLVTAFMWFIIPLLYEYMAFKYYSISHLSFECYWFITLYLIVFLSVSNFIVKKRITNEGLDSFERPTMSNHIRFWAYLIFFCNMFLIFRFFTVCGSFSIIKIIVAFRILTTTGDGIPPDMKLLLYVFTMTAPLLLAIYFFKIRIKLPIKIGIIIELLLVTVFYASKARVFKYFIMIFLLLFVKKKLNFKNTFFFIIIGGGALVGMVLIRDEQFISKSYSFMDYVYVYLLSPLPAFDLLVQGEVPYVTTPVGGRTLGFFYRLLHKFSFNIALPEYDKMFIRVSAPSGTLPTNVYTAFGNSFMDWGFLGIVVYGILSAILFSIYYKNLKKPVFLFLYLLTIYCLYFQFFGEFYFQFLSMGLQDIFAVIIILKKTNTVNYVFKYSGYARLEK